MCGSIYSRLTTYMVVDYYHRLTLLILVCFGFIFGFAFSTVLQSPRAHVFVRSRSRSLEIGGFGRCHYMRLNWMTRRHMFKLKGTIVFLKLAPSACINGYVS
jgi:hypothetical protein